MSYQNPRQERIRCGSSYNMFRHVKRLTMKEYMAEYVGEEHYKSVRSDSGEFLYRCKYCKTIPEVRGERKRYQNKSYARKRWQKEVKNHHKRTRHQYKKNLKELNDDILQKGIGREI